MPQPSETLLLEQLQPLDKPKILETYPDIPEPVIDFLLTNQENPCLFWPDQNLNSPYEQNKQGQAQLANDLCNKFQIDRKTADNVADMIFVFFKAPIITDRISEVFRGDNYEQRRNWRRDLEDISYRGIPGRTIRSFFESSKTRAKNRLGTIAMYLDLITSDYPEESEERHMYTEFCQHTEITPDNPAKFEKRFNKKPPIEKVREVYRFEKAIASFLYAVHQQNHLTPSP